MVRPKKKRTVSGEPEVTYFKPRGIPLSQLDEVGLSVEELEALRLKDLEGLDQKECGRKMKVSRATFRRVLTSARRKVALSLVDGKAIMIKGGDYMIGRGRGRGFGMGPGGNCVCPGCGFKKVHVRGVPCFQEKCPKCGGSLVRER